MTMCTPYLKPSDSIVHLQLPQWTCPMQSQVTNRKPSDSLGICLRNIRGILHRKWNHPRVSFRRKSIFGCPLQSFYPYIQHILTFPQKITLFLTKFMHKCMLEIKPLPTHWDDTSQRPPISISLQIWCVLVYPFGMLLTKRVSRFTTMKRCPHD